MPPSHICQFFDSDESRAECVSSFLEPGLWAGERLIVIARPAVWAGILERFERRKAPIQEALAEERVIVLDALDTLRRLSPGGRRPDARAFQDLVGGLLRGPARGPIRAYGEMVDILAERRDFEGVLALEGLWNDAASRTPYSLLCGYSAAHFVSPAVHASMRGICHAHTHVERSVQDPLANWLLMSAHNCLSGPGLSH